MKAVIFRHDTKDIGSFADTLLKADVSYEILDTWRDDVPAGFDPLAPDLLIVMGGAPGVYQSDSYPFLQQELKVLETRLAADLPTLGICLGAQLMAGALGARNYKGENGRELGWHTLQVTDAGMKTPVAHLDQRYTKIAQSHSDTFELPNGAILLASSAQYENQIFSWGRNGLGIQCHPEANAGTCRGWYVSYASTIYSDKIDLNEWRRQTAEYLPVMERQSAKFLNEWLQTVRREHEVKYA